MNKQQYQLLVTLLTRPTAPFREEHVIASVAHALQPANVPFFLDPIGNVVVGCASYTQYQKLVRRKTTEPLRVFIAHMDHPGFHGVRWVGNDLEIKWHGGSPVEHVMGSDVWLATATGMVAEGKLHRIKLTRTRRAIDHARVELITPWRTRRPAATSLYGGFKFRAPVWRKGSRLYTKAADDLVGVFAVVNTAIELFRRKPSAGFLGLLTRAEEVGFIGAVAHFELGWLASGSRPILCVSLETSRTLPNALIGSGPVVRLGDRRTVFDPAALNVLTTLAQRLLPRRHQRRIMDGGTCEATAALAYGFPAVGLSVPLGNYHNQGFEGGPNCRARNGPAPEFVDVRDVDGLLKLCRGLMQPDLAWGTPWRQQKDALRKNLRRYRALM